MTFEIFKERLGSQFSEREIYEITRAVKEDLLNWSLPYPERELTTEEKIRLEDSLIALLSGTPLAYVTGVSHFYDFKLFVDQNVLIPRPETAELVHTVIQDYKTVSSNFSILEIGTGSGCIALGLSKHLSMADITAIETSPNALKVAQKNARELGLEVTWLVVDFLRDFSSIDKNWDIITSNPPYIEPQERDRMDPHVIMHEPHLALFTEENNGLIFYQKIYEFAKERQTSGQKVYLEMNEFRSDEIDLIFSNQQMYKTKILYDLNGKPRILRAIKN